VRQLLVLAAGQEHVPALDADEHGDRAEIGVLPHLLRVARHPQRAAARARHLLQQVDLLHREGKEPGQVDRLRVDEDGEELRVDAAFLEPRQIDVTLAVPGEEIVALVEHRFGDVGVRIHHYGIAMQRGALRRNRRGF